MKIRKTILMFIGLAICLSIIAAPARRDGKALMLPNGEELTVYLHGDEFFHWETDAEGNWIERQADGSYKRIPALSTKEIERQRRLSPIYREPEEIAAARTASKPSKGVIILVNFSNINFTLNADNIYDAMNMDGYTNPQVGAGGSVHDYFKTSSNGQYIPQFDIWGPYTLSQTSSYYGGSTGTVNGYKMVQEACSLAYADGKSFAAYSTSNNLVDFVYVIFAGYDKAQHAENTVWAHAFSLADAGISKQNRTFGGYTIDKYACSSELLGTSGSNQNGIGTFCHEFSHILGLPDYYVTGDYPKSNPNYDLTNGMWSLMDYGCYNNLGWTPCQYSAYDKYYMGWDTPTLLNSARNDTLPALSGNAGSTRVITAAGKMPLYTYTAEAWYIENRQQTGWDSYLPGHGLIVTKVKYNSTAWTLNTVNNSTPMLYDVQEAGGKLSYFGDPSDPFPGTMNITTYTPTGNYTLSEINELSDGKVAFKFMGGITPTGMENGKWKMETGKLRIEDGIVIIERQGRKYNLLGNRICR